MNNTIKLSVIVPVYNVAPYLKSCIDSILYGIASDTEIILIDDGSTDESGTICDDYAARMPQVRVRHQQNAGLSAARNAGLSAARGEYISYVDSDDFVSSSAINAIVGQMDQTEADVAVADYVPISPQTPLMLDDKDYSDVASSTIGTDEFLINIQKYTMMVWNKVYRRKVFEECRFVEGAIFEDVDYIHKILMRQRKFIYVPCTLYYYRIQRKGSTAFTFNKNRLLGYPFFDRFGRYVKNDYPAECNVAVATYIADFFQAQYYECKTLINDKKIMADIMGIYKKYVRDTPWTISPLYRFIFRLSPWLYILIKRLKNKTE